MGKNRDGEQLESLEGFIDQGIIEEVLGVVKSGKEATVYGCRAIDGGGLVAAKVYRSRNVRGFRDDSAYNAGRMREGHRREARAIANRSRIGRTIAFSRWVAEEYATLQILHVAGCDVPRPIAVAENAIIMEYIGDEDTPAAMLSGVRLEAGEARRVFDLILANIELALACDRIHADLSAFNVLYHHGDLRIIDFPQAVDPRFNHNAAALLERDIGNICGHFARYGIDADPPRIARSLWARFLRGDL